MKCEHERAVHLFVDSLLNKDHLGFAYQCTGPDRFKKGICLSCRKNRCNNMGYNAKKMRKKRNSRMYLKTRADTPFAGKIRPGPPVSDPFGSRMSRCQRPRDCRNRNLNFSCLMCPSPSFSPQFGKFHFLSATTIGHWDVPATSYCTCGHPTDTKPYLGPSRCYNIAVTDTRLWGKFRCYIRPLTG